MNMNKSDLLLEIGLEEIPARFVVDAANQLADRVRELLTEQHIGFGKIHVYSTPRRLAVLVEEVNEKQDDLHEEVKGPAKKSLLMKTAIGQRLLQVLLEGKGKPWMIFILKKSTVLNMSMLLNIFKVAIPWMY